MTKLKPRDAVIVAAARSPIGRAFKGSLISMRPDDLLAQMLTAALAQVPEIDVKTIDDVYIGCGQPAGEQGYNIARVANLLAGIDVPGATIHRYCSSSLLAIRMAAHAIKAGEGEVYIAGGVECVSRYGLGRADGMPNTHNPKFAAAEARTIKRSQGKAPKWTPFQGGLPDIYITMGETAENVAQKERVSRERQDEYACLSQNRAEAAIAKGFFKTDITPVTLPDGTVVDKDDSPRAGTTLEKLAQLAPAFRPDGTVTAGNACPLNDGAAALVLTSARHAQKLGLKPLARIVASGVGAIDPEIMGLGPVPAVKQALKRARLKIDDIDLVELNEAFAAQVIPCADKLGIDWAKLNVNGGAIALGHPFGQTGARIMTTLIHNLQAYDQTLGLEAMCVAGGQGMAMIIERLR